MTQFTAEEHLLTALSRANVSPEEYRPAYSGESVGLDLYYAGAEPIVVKPRVSTLIPTGLRISLAPSQCGLILQRGSIHKTNLIHRAGVIDPGFSGVIQVQCLNLGTEDTVIAPYQKLPFQLVVVPADTQFCYVDSTTYEQVSRHGQRQEACIGSSDTHAKP